MRPMRRARQGPGCASDSGEAEEAWAPLRAVVMKVSRFGWKSLVWIGSAFYLSSFEALNSFASQSASDDACNYSIHNWETVNGGAGFGAWTLSTSSGGNFRGNSNNNGGGGGPGINCSSGAAWGMWASGYSRATRPFTAGSTPSAVLQVGQTFSIDMDNGWANNGASVGVALRNSSTQDVFTFKFVGGTSSYQVNNATPPSPVSYTEGGLRVEFTLTGATTYSVKVYKPNTGSASTYTGTLLNPGGGRDIDRAFFYNDGAGSGSQRDVFFNTMNITCPAFSISAQPANAATCQGGQPTFTVAASAAATPTYKWQVWKGGSWVDATASDGSGFNTATFTTVAATAGMNGYKYRCIVTDACGTGVTSDGNATLTVYGTPSAGSPGKTDNVVCGGTAGTITVTASGGSGSGYQYSKDNGVTWQGGNSFGSLAAGTYLVRVKDSCGTMSAAASVTIADPNGPGLSLSQVGATCNAGNDGQITATFSGGVGPYQVKIDAGSFSTQTSPYTFTGLAPGAHTIVVKDSSGCQSSDSISVTQPTAVTVTENVGAHVNVLCRGDSTGSITLNAASGGNGGAYQYSKDDGATWQGGTTFSGLASGTYKMRAKDNKGCVSAAVNVTITQPGAAVNGTITPASAAVCEGSSQTFTAAGSGGTPGYTYAWTGPNGFSAATAAITINNAVAANAGTYTCEITDANGCVVQKTATLSLNPAAAVTTQPSAASTCSGGSVNLTVVASGSPSYIWRKRDPTLGWGSAWSFSYNSGACDSWNGIFVADSTTSGQNPGINKNSKAFGLYANNWNAATALRNFGALQVGQRVEFDFQLPKTLTGDNGGGTKSIALVGVRNSANATARLELWAQTGDSYLTVSDGDGNESATVPYDSNGYRVSIVLTGANTYRMRITRLATNTSYDYARTLKGVANDPISQFRAYMRNFSVGGSDRNLYFNNLVAGAYEDDASNYTGGGCGTTTWDTNGNQGFGPLANGGSYSGVTTATLGVNPVTGTETGDYDVLVYNACGSALSSPAAVSIVAVGAAGAITGLDQVCPSQTGVAYSISAVSGATSYSWTVPSGATIVSGQGTTSITVNFGGSSGNVAVTPKNGSCSGTAASLAVTVSGAIGAPGAIAGAAVVCQGESGLRYSIPAVSGASSYNWTLPAGASITAGAGTREITVDWGTAVSGTLSVRAVNACATSTVSSLSVKIGTALSITTQPASLTGCSGSSASLTVAASGSDLRYAWRKKDVAAGWGAAWQFGYNSGSCGSGNGIFIGDATESGQSPGINTASSKAFGLYANNTNSLSVTRAFGAAQIGQTIQFDLQLPRTLSGTDGSLRSMALVALRNSANPFLPRLELWAQAGDSYLTVSDGAGDESATVPYSSNGYRVTVVLTSANTYKMTIVKLDTNASYSYAGTLKGTAGDPINQFRAYLRNFDPGGASRNFYFNRILAGAYTDEASNYTGGGCGSTTWESSPDRGYGPLADGSPYSGVSAATLTINPVSGTEAGDYDVVVWNGCGVQVSSAATLTVASVGAAGAITGAGSVDAGETGKSYSISAVSGATSYLWTAPAGAAIVSGQGTTSISVDYGCSAVSGSIQVTPQGAGGCTGTAATLPVTVATAGTPGAITGPGNVDPNEVGVVYSIAPVGGASGYTWSVPPGATITAGQGTTSITVTFGISTGAVQVVALNANNCAGAPSKLHVDLTTCPPNMVPRIAPLSNQSVQRPGTMSFSVTANDPGCVAPSLSVANLPSGASFNTSVSGTNQVGTFSWTPTVAQVGTHLIRFIATDVENLTTDKVIRLYVADVGEPTNNAGVPQSQIGWAVGITNIHFGSGGNVTVVWESASGIVYDMYRSDNGFNAGPMTWTKAMNRFEANASTSEYEVVSAVTQRYFQVVAAGESPTTEGLWAVIKVPAPHGLSMASVPVGSDRKFDGEMGAAFARAFAPNSDELYILDGGLWEVLHVDAGGVWRNAQNQPYTTPLPQGNGLFVFRNSVSGTQVTFAGPVGNRPSGTNIISVGWNILGFSEGKYLPLSAMFEGAMRVSGAPTGDYDEEVADLIVLQNPDGSWRRLIRLPNDTWFDLKTGAPATMMMRPGQAYYYYRQNSGGSMQVRF